MKDMHKNIKVLTAIYPRAVGTTGAANGVTSPVIDRQGFETVEFVYQAGGSASAADTVTPVVLECATTGGTFTSVADADLIGDETAVTRTTAAGVQKSIGYRGNKRYLKTKMYGIGGATGLVAASVILGRPNVAPIAT